MQFEVEEKFPVPSSSVFDEIRTLGEVAGYALRYPEQHRICHAYLDTELGTLHRRGMSLRLKEKAGAFFVTYKRHVDGTHVRKEIEEALTPAEARLLMLGATPTIGSEALREAEKYLGGRPVRPILRVENARESWHLGTDENDAKICFDRVHFHSLLDADAGVRTAYELELELRKGGRPFVQRVAHTLALEYGLSSSSQSKYEHGVALFGLFDSPVRAVHSAESSQFPMSDRVRIHE